MIAGKRRFQNWTAARVMWCCLSAESSEFTETVIAGLAEDRSFYRRFLGHVRPEDRSIVIRRVDLARRRAAEYAR